MEAVSRPERRRQARAARKSQPANVGPFFTNRAIRRASLTVIAAARQRRREQTERAWVQLLARRRAERALARKAADR